MENLGNIQEINETLREGRSMIMFSAKWCGSCRKMKPKIETLTELHKNVNFYYVDITEFEDEDEVIAEYSVGKIPSFVFYNNGTEFARVQGSKDRQNILDNLDFLNNIEENEEVEMTES